MWLLLRVRACRKPPKLCRRYGPAPSPWEASVADHLETRSTPMYFHTKFRRSRSNRMGVCRVPNFSERWGPAALG